MSYQTNEYEQKLISSSTDINQLSILQKNTLTRLQFFVHNKKHFIKSTQDNYRNLRIILLSLLIKIYEEYSDQNKKRLQKIKNIIYSSSLQKTVNQYCILRQQLHKVIAIQLKKLQIGFQAESYLLNMFNCVPFFDQILIKSFQQKFSLSDSLIQSQTLQKIIKQQFTIQINWNAENIQNQNQNQICLWKSNDNILRESALNMTFIGESSSQGSAHNSNRGSNKRRKKTKSKTVLLQTISMCDSKSPFEFQNTRKKQKQLKYENQNIEGFDQMSGRSSKRLINKNINQNPQIHKVKEGKKRGIWDILCCSSDK